MGPVKLFHSAVQLQVNKQTFLQLLPEICSKVKLMRKGDFQRLPLFSKFTICNYTDDV